jgi:hypothetical protein
MSLSTTLVAEHGALAGVGQHDELVAEVTADRPVSARIGIAFSPMRAKVRR